MPGCRFPGKFFIAGHAVLAPRRLDVLGRGIDAPALRDEIGGRVPVDGTITDGAAELDESMITGESRPVAKKVDDAVVAGTVSTDSSIRIRVDATGDDTALAGIQRLVEEAQSSHSRAQAMADRFAGWLFYAAIGSGFARQRHPVQRDALPAGCFTPRSGPGCSPSWSGWHSASRPMRSSGR